VNAEKYFSPRFLLFLVLTSTLIAVYWALSMPTYPAYYTFVLGAVLSSELAVHVRHFGNLFLFSTKLTADHISGRIEYARPLMLRMSSVQLLGFAILFAVSFAVTGSWFAAGGMFSCSVLTAKHWLLARRASVKRLAASGKPASDNQVLA